MGKRKTSIVIDEELWKEWMSFTINKYGSSRRASQEVEAALREYLAKHKK